jgi:hypothetical protein
VSGGVKQKVERVAKAGKEAQEAQGNPKVAVAPVVKVVLVARVTDFGIV